jgi:alcohol dehydrogenase class IV
MTPFAIQMPGRVLYGRGEAAKAAGLICGFGARGVLVHGATLARAEWLIRALRAAGAEVHTVACAHEPLLADLEANLAATRAGRPDWVVAIGGGAVLDMGKALAALLPQATQPLDHLEGVGRGLPLANAPLPFAALPTTSGTGSEATRNAVIGVPERGVKVSLRDDRMLARLAIVDPALTDGCPRAVTLASGLDAITQVIEPYLSNRANPFTDALCLPAIGAGLPALMRLMQTEDAAARDVLAWVSLSGGIALGHAGLGAVHGLAGVIGGRTGAAHGAICGALLGPVLAMNRRLAPAEGDTARRIGAVTRSLAATLGCSVADAPQALHRWAHKAGLTDLGAMGVAPADHESIAAAALASSSMQANPVVPSPGELIRVLAEAGGS